MSVDPVNKKTNQTIMNKNKLIIKGIKFDNEVAIGCTNLG